MKIAMTWFLLSLTAAGVQAQTVPALLCSVQGAQLRNSESVQSQLVSAQSPSNLAISLGEDQGSGTYMTYVHVQLSYSATLKQSLGVLASAEFSQVHETKLTGAMSAKIKLASRVQRPDMELLITCQPQKLDYLLVPNKAYPQDPLFSFQSVATNLEDYLQKLKSQPYSMHPNAADESEYLANNFCIQGDADYLLKSLQTLATSKSVAGFWHADALGQSQLLPNSLKLSATGINWSQPLQSATCTASHTEQGVDEDQLPVEYTVCDHYRVDDLTPLALEIPVCK